MPKNKESNEKIKEKLKVGDIVTHQEFLSEIGNGKIISIKGRHAYVDWEKGKSDQKNCSLSKLWLINNRTPDLEEDNKLLQIAYSIGHKVGNTGVNEGPAYGESSYQSVIQKNY